MEGEGSLGPRLEKTDPSHGGFSLKSECPRPRKEVRQSQGRREVHTTVYLAEKLGSPGLSQSSPSAVSKSSTATSQWENGINNDQKQPTATTGHSHNWTQRLLPRNQGEGTRRALQGRINRNCSTDPSLCLLLPPGWS